MCPYIEAYKLLRAYTGTFRLGLGGHVGALASMVRIQVVQAGLWLLLLLGPGEKGACSLLLADSLGGAGRRSLSLSLTKAHIAA